jgi:hypothetical protein
MEKILDKFQNRNTPSLAARLQRVRPLHSLGNQEQFIIRGFIFPVFPHPFSKGFISGCICEV